ncbi:MAG: hypothetical protein LBU85_11280 [Treponema sp.]|nr:hypothetical protein [Treponema sp.]
MNWGLGVGKGFWGKFKEAPRAWRKLFKILASAAEKPRDDPVRAEPACVP